MYESLFFFPKDLVWGAGSWAGSKGEICSWLLKQQLQKLSGGLSQSSHCGSLGMELGGELVSPPQYGCGSPLWAQGTDNESHQRPPPGQLLPPCPIPSLSGCSPTSCLLSVHQRFHLTHIFGLFLYTVSCSLAASSHEDPRGSPGQRRGLEKLLLREVGS